MLDKTKVDRKAVIESLKKLGLQISATGSESVATKADIDELLKGKVDELNKSFDDIKNQMIKAMESLPDDNLTKADIKSVMDDVVETIGDKFAVVGEVEKAVYDRVDEVQRGLTESIGNMTDTIGELSKAITGLVSDVKKIGDTPNPQRSYLSHDYVERGFSKGEGGNGGETIMSASRDRNKLLDVMEKAVGDLEKAGNDNFMLNTMLTFESSGVISDRALKVLKDDHKIIVVS